MREPHANCVIRAARSLAQIERDGWFNSAQQLLAESFPEKTWTEGYGEVSIVNAYDESWNGATFNYPALYSRLPSELPESSLTKIVAETTGILRLSRQGRLRLAVRLALPALLEESSASSEFLVREGLRQVSRNKTAPHFTIGSISSKSFNQDEERATEVGSKLRALVPETACLEPVHYVLRARGLDASSP